MTPKNTRMNPLSRKTNDDEPLQLQGLRNDCKPKLKDRKNPNDPLGDRIVNEMKYLPTTETSGHGRREY
jgi:hypothetical protein